MKRNESNSLQKNKDIDEKNKNVKVAKENKEEIKFIEEKIKDNKNVQVVEITPRLSSITPSTEELDFNEKVDALAEELKNTILRLHKEGNSVRFIAKIVGMSRESVRKTIKGECSLKILAMDRIRAQEVQQLKF